MATISSLGIGSGLDANGIITKLVDLEKQPLKALQSKAASIQARISSFGQIQSQFSSLNDVLQRIASPAVWSGTNAGSSNASAATITATSTAPAASFSLDVDVLAKAQSVSSMAITPGSAVGAGTLTLQLGSWNTAGATPTFTGATGSNPLQITVSATDTLNDVASKINAANGGNPGVTATVFNDGTNDHLLLKSTTTGAVNGFRIQAADADGNNTDNAGLSRLAFDPNVSPAFGMASAGQPIQYGVDAQARINGLAVTSPTNTLGSNLPGVTINLLTTTTTNFGTANEVRAPISMSVSKDTSVAVKNVQSFVTAYNALGQTLSDLTKYDPASKTGGPFQGDASVVGLQNMLRNMVSSVGTSGSVYQRLSDVGVSVQRDGSLAIDSVKLGAAANNGSQLQTLFTNSSTPQTSGFAVRFGSFTRNALNTAGLVTNEAGALQRQLDANGKDQAAVNQRVANVQAQLTKQYSALDAKMGSLSALNSYVSQQVTLWNKSGG